MFSTKDATITSESRALGHGVAPAASQSSLDTARALFNLKTRGDSSRKSQATTLPLCASCPADSSESSALDHGCPNKSPGRASAPPTQISYEPPLYRSVSWALAVLLHRMLKIPYKHRQTKHNLCPSAFSSFTDKNITDWSYLKNWKTTEAKSRTSAPLLSMLSYTMAAYSTQ